MIEKLGLSDWDPALYAAYKSRDIMDYRRKGGSMTAYLMPRLIPFLNPALQGTEKAVRTGLWWQVHQGAAAPPAVPDVGTPKQDVRG